MASSTKVAGSAWRDLVSGWLIGATLEINFSSAGRDSGDLLESVSCLGSSTRTGEGERWLWDGVKISSDLGGTASGEASCGFQWLTSCSGSKTSSSCTSSSSSSTSPWEYSSFFTSTWGCWISSWKCAGENFIDVSESFFRVSLGISGSFFSKSKSSSLSLGETSSCISLKSSCGMSPFFSPNCSSRSSRLGMWDSGITWWESELFSSVGWICSSCRLCSFSSLNSPDWLLLVSYWSMV